jgi:small subunit ribosomal protein S2
VEELKGKTMEEKTNTTAPAAVKKLEIKLPEIKDLLAAGVQFGHQTQKWNPKMKDYIFTSKNKIHILDLTKTETKLQEALEFLYQAAKRGNILFVGTKRQASEIVKEAAVNSGSFYITHRWPGGLLTNFKLIQKSIKRLNQLEEEFEKGVTNRTKFEVSQQKKEWERMNRIYEGVKSMERFPTAVVIVDTKYERLAIREATGLNIPIVAMVDTNCDPTIVSYPVPANDDAIRSVSIIVNMFAEAIKKGNEGRGVKHTFKDYSVAEIQVIKKEEVTQSAEEKELPLVREEKAVVEEHKSNTGPKQKGILETIQENKKIVEKKPVKASKKVETKEETKPVAKKVVKKAVTKAKK